MHENMVFAISILFNRYLYCIRSSAQWTNVLLTSILHRTVSLQPNVDFFRSGASAFGYDKIVNSPSNISCTSATYVAPPATPPWYQDVSSGTHPFAVATTWSNFARSSLWIHVIHSSDRQVDSLCHARRHRKSRVLSLSSFLMYARKSIFHTYGMLDVINRASHLAHRSSLSKFECQSCTSSWSCLLDAIMSPIVVSFLRRWPA